MLEEPKATLNIFLYSLLAGCVVAILVSFYFFYFKKDYEFIVEVSCDPRVDTCLQRDCSNPDDCPPNQLESFKRYSLNAADFAKCENEDCSAACSEKIIQCEQLACVDDPVVGESCISEHASSPWEVQ